MSLSVQMEDDEFQRERLASLLKTEGLEVGSVQWRGRGTGARFNVLS
ncbi:hypothetical protein ACVWVY_006048 [Bradyrhizobium sp. URHC0002]